MSEDHTDNESSHEQITADWIRGVEEQQLWRVENEECDPDDLGMGLFQQIIPRLQSTNSRRTRSS